MCTFGVLGLSCEAPAVSGPPGFHLTGPNVRIVSRSSKTEPKFDEKTPREARNNENGGGRG